MASGKRATGVDSREMAGARPVLRRTLLITLTLATLLLPGSVRAPSARRSAPRSCPAPHNETRHEELRSSAAFERARAVRAEARALRTVSEAAERAQAASTRLDLALSEAEADAQRRVALATAEVEARWSAAAAEAATEAESAVDDALTAAAKARAALEAEEAAASERFARLEGLLAETSRRLDEANAAREAAEAKAVRGVALDGWGRAVAVLVGHARALARATCHAAGGGDAEVECAALAGAAAAALLGLCVMLPCAALLWRAR